MPKTRKNPGCTLTHISNWVIPPGPSSPFLVTTVGRQGNSDPRPHFAKCPCQPPYLPPSWLEAACPQWRQYLQARHMDRLHVICTKNSKALFSSKNAHPHCPGAPVTQTITPSSLAPPWPGGGDAGSSTQGFAPCQAQEAECKAHLWHWKEKPTRLERGLRATQHF